MAEVVVEKLSRNFGTFQALKEVSFHVADGQFLTLLGPSGCGKSTTLTALAGLDRPSAGKISIGPRVVYDGAKDIFIDAQFRDLGLMFQSYALWPHMDVAANIGYGLRMRGAARDEIARRVDEMLKLLKLEGYGGRAISALSGGQKQRVALGRALAIEPKVLLLDEPFGALDALTRERLNLELLRLQTAQRQTVVMVTHSINEAVFLADRVLVLGEQPGRILAHVPVRLPRPRSLAVMGSQGFGGIATEIRRHIGLVEEEGY